MVRSFSSLVPSQQKYVTYRLHKFHLHTIKPITTHSATWTILSLTHGELLADSIEYQSIVDALQYLTITHPDIAYAVHVVS